MADAAARRVLLLAYHFAPIGGPGAQRAIKLSRDLPATGWRPIVVSGPGLVGGPYTPADAGLASDVPAGTPIHRAAGSVPAAGSRAASLARWSATPSPFGRWWRRAALEAGLRAAAGGVDAIVVTMSPFDGAAAAAELSRRLAVPWVADLRDPWALDEMITYPTALHRAREIRRMGRDLSSAAAIVMNCDEARARVVARLRSVDAERVHVVTNGWDAADFRAPPPPPPDGLRIVHTGTLHTAEGRRHDERGRLRRLAGGAAAIRVLPRSHVYLLQALRLLREREPLIAADVEVHLAGALTDADRAESGDLPVVHHGYLDHPDSVALLRSGDLLFLPMHDLPVGRRATIVPGKTYEYLATGRPLLATLPDGDARDLVGRMDAVSVCRPTDVAAIAAVVADAVRAKRARGASLPVVARPELERFERRRLAAQLGAILDEVARPSGR